MKSLLNKPFLSMTDYTPEEFAYYLDLAAALKKDKKEGKEIQTLKGKNFALIFEKDSTRTRCAFEVAARDQRAFTTYLGPTGSQIGKKESIADTARVLASMFDGIEEASSSPLSKNSQPRQAFPSGTASPTTTTRHRPSPIS